MKSKTQFALFLALTKFPTWKTKDFENLGFKKVTIYKYKKYLKDADEELNEKLKR